MKAVATLRANINEILEALSSTGGVLKIEQHGRVWIIECSSYCYYEVEEIQK